MMRFMAIVGKVMLVLVPLSLLFTKATDADMIDSKTIAHNSWEATTLDFTNRDTASNQVTSLLFNTVGLVSGGFSVKSVRIKKDGQLNFQYKIASKVTAGDMALCDNLGLDLYKNWEKVKTDSVGLFSYDTRMSQAGVDDWVIVTRLLSDNKQVQNMECDFELWFKTESDQRGGFSAERRLENRITSGRW